MSTTDATLACIESYGTLTPLGEVHAAIALNMAHRMDTSHRQAMGEGATDEPGRHSSRHLPALLDDGGMMGRHKSDSEPVDSQREARALTKIGDARERLFRLWKAEGKKCFRCGSVLDWSLSGLDPKGPTWDHVGLGVADCVGLTRGEAKKILLDYTPDGSLSGGRGRSAVSHRYCNASAGRGNAVTSPPSYGGDTPRPPTGGSAPYRPRGRTWSREERSEISEAMLGFGRYKDTPPEERRRILAQLPGGSNYRTDGAI